MTAGAAQTDDTAFAVQDGVTEYQSPPPPPGPPCTGRPVVFHKTIIPSACVVRGSRRRFSSLAVAARLSARMHSFQSDVLHIQFSYPRSKCHSRISAARTAPAPVPPVHLFRCKACTPPCARRIELTAIGKPNPAGDRAINLPCIAHYRQPHALSLTLSHSRSLFHSPPF